MQEKDTQEFFSGKVSLRLKCRSKKLSEFRQCWVEMEILRQQNLMKGCCCLFLWDMCWHVSVCDILLLVCVVYNMCLFLCCVVFVQFLLGVTNRNGDQIRQEFLSGKVVSRELWQNTEPCSRCIFFQSAPALRLTCISFLCRAEIVFCTACSFSHWLDYFALAAFFVTTERLVEFFVTPER